MPEKPRNYEFRIDAYTPNSIPMNRLAEYLANLASLLGEHKSVHFVKLRPGSLKVVHRVEYEAEPKVRERLRLAKNSDESNDATEALRRIDRTLAEDNASGYLREPGGHRIIEFPGRKRFVQPKFGPFIQPGTIDGIPIYIGGKNQTVSIHLEDGDTVHVCSAKRPIAKDIASYLFTGIIRADGTAKWTRESDGTWSLDQFTIHSFRPLDDVPIGTTIAQLRKIDIGLGEHGDTLDWLHQIRHGKEAVG